MAIWKKVYVRDEGGVMRALPGIKIVHQTGTLWLAKSVYDLSSDGSSLDADWLLGELKPESDWGWGQ